MLDYANGDSMLTEQQATATIGRLRRNMPRNPDVLQLCEFAEALMVRTPEAKPKSKRAAEGSFDRRAYQRELMRKRRAAAKQSD